MIGASVFVFGGEDQSRRAVNDLYVLDINFYCPFHSRVNVHSPQATMIGASVFVFGGEDRSRRTVNDLYGLDMATLAWSRPAAEGVGPSPRSAHVACSFEDRYLCPFYTHLRLKRRKCLKLQRT
jgi:hypothetical protein